MILNAEKIIANRIFFYFLFIMGFSVFVCLVGCGGSGAEQEAEAAMEIIISSVYPTDGATGVPVTTEVRATFSDSLFSASLGKDQGIEGAAVNASDLTLYSSEGVVTGTVTYDAASFTAAFIPSVNLLYSTTYTATVSVSVGRYDGDDIGGAYSWSFTTATSEVTATTTTTSTTTSTTSTTTTTTTTTSTSTSSTSLATSSTSSVPSSTSLTTSTLGTSTTSTITTTTSTSPSTSTITASSTTTSTISTTSTTIGVLDTTPPLVSLTPLTPDPNNDYNPSLTGIAIDTASDIVKVEFSVEGYWGTATALDGSFDSTVEAFTFTTTAFLDGIHTVEVRATDSSGNTTEASNYASDTFRIDTTEPIISILTPAIGTTNDHTPMLTGWATDEATNIAGVEYRVDEGEWVDANGDFNSLSVLYSHEVSVLSDGLHVIEARATDLAGNTTESYGYAERSINVYTE